LFDPHEPWDPPEYLVRRYDPDYTGTPMLMPNYGLASRYRPAELANLRAHYLAETELVDRHVGRILEKIDDLELWDDTVVVFASDHGTSLGEHGRTSKVNRDPDDHRYWTLSPELSHVPLLLAAPSVTAGIRHPVYAQPVDLMPTLFDLSGVSGSGPVATPEPLHGHSLAAVLRGRAGGPRRATLSGSCPGEIAPGDDWPRGINTPFLIADDYGYAPIGEDGTAQLFDLAADPLAERPLGADGAAFAAGHARLRELLQEIEAPPWLLEFFDRSRRGRG
jgi:arylsulfatase A-like enzyme